MSNWHLLFLTALVLLVFGCPNQDEVETTIAPVSKFQSLHDSIMHYADTRQSDTLIQLYSDTILSLVGPELFSDSLGDHAMDVLIDTYKRKSLCSCIIPLVRAQSNYHYRISPGGNRWMKTGVKVPICYFYQEQYDSAHYYLDRLIADVPAITSENAASWAYMHMAKGVSSRRQANLLAAKKSFDTALEVADSFKLERVKANAYTNQMNIYEPLGEMDKAVEVTYNAFKIYEALQDTAGMCVSLGNLGMLSLDLNDLNQAEKYLKRCIRIQNKREKAIAKDNAYRDLAIIAAKRDSFNKALSLIDSALAYTDAAFYEAIHLRVKAGILHDKNADLNEALQSLDRSDSIMIVLGNQQKIWKNHITRADILVSMDRADEAYELLSIARDSLERGGLLSGLKDLYPVMHKVLSVLDRREEAQDIFSSYVKVQNGIVGDHHDIVINELNGRIQTEKLKNEVLQREKYTRNALLIGVFSFVFLIGLLVKTIRVRNQQRNAHLNVLGDLRVQLNDLMQPLQPKKESTSIHNEAFDRDAPIIRIGNNPESLLEQQLEILQQEINSLEEDLSAFRTSNLNEKEVLSAQLDQLRAFQYSVFHDLKAPIGKVRYTVSQLSEQLPPGDPRITQLSTQLNGLEELLRGLAVLIDVERLTLFTLPFCLIELVGGIAQDVQSQLEARRAELALDIENVCFDTDRYLLRIVLTNLITNAIKYQRPDASLKIKVFARYTKTEQLIKVCDNGRGWPSYVKGEIFKPFYQVSNTAPDGDGLGLFICARIIEKLGGQIEASAAENQGAEFIIKLPVGASVPVD